MDKKYEKPVKLTLTVDVDLKDVGEMLIADDPELHPLVGHGFDVQAALMEKLGWTDDLQKVLYVSGDSWQRNAARVQAWAMSMLGLDPEVLFCSRCGKPIEPGKAMFGKESEVLGEGSMFSDGEYGPLHEKCRDDWKRQVVEMREHDKKRDEERKAYLSEEQRKVIRENPLHRKCRKCLHEEDLYAAMAIPDGALGKYRLLFGSDADFCTKCGETWGGDEDERKEFSDK